MGAATSGIPWLSASPTVFMPPWQTTASSSPRRMSSSTGARSTATAPCGSSDAEGSDSGGAAITACTWSPSSANALAARAWKSALTSAARVPMVSSTRRRPGSNRSQANERSAGRSVNTGPTRANCSGYGSAPVSAGPVSARTRRGEKRGSVYSCGGSPARCHNAVSWSVIQDSTFGRARNGRPISIAPGARLAQGSPCRCAVSAPAGVCWSTTTTSGRYSSTVRSRAFAVKRA